VYFSVLKFREYGKLSKKNPDDLLAGARIEIGEFKKDPLDFALWKPQKTPDEQAWDSPWGKGRPGWHIECSVMATKYLGSTLDIHGGGIDLIHPHHENEIAQSEALTAKPFAKYWMHNNMLTFQAEKMSKSVGNIILVREYNEKYSAEALKFLLLAGHYRSTIDVSERHIRESQAAIHRVYSTIAKVEKLEALPISGQGSVSPKETSSVEETSVQNFGNSFRKKWTEAMDDDFNTARVIGLVFEYVREMNAYADRKNFKKTQTAQKILEQFLSELKSVTLILNLFGEDSSTYLNHLKQLIIRERGVTAKEIETSIQARQVARQQKNFAAADRIRQELNQKGIELRDSPNGTEWDVSFATPVSPYHLEP